MTFQALSFVKKENLLKFMCKKQPRLCCMVQNSSSSVVLQLLKVMQSKTHKKCPTISCFTIYAVYQVAGRELEFQETRDVEGVMYACHNRCRVSLWVTQMDLAKVIREGLWVRSVTICMESSIKLLSFKSPHPSISCYLPFPRKWWVACCGIKV